MFFGLLILGLFVKYQLQCKSRKSNFGRTANFLLLFAFPLVPSHYYLESETRRLKNQGLPSVVPVLMVPFLKFFLKDNLVKRKQ
mgnify:CR=1 FL=1